MRIRGYVGKLPTPRTMQEGAQILKASSGSQFPRFTDEQWEAMARGTWREADGRLAPHYDPNLMRVLETLDPETPLPDLWPLFENLKPFPVLAIRGANSDLLSAETLAAMQQRHPRLKAVTVPDQGHAPALDGDLIPLIRPFILEAEASA